MWRRPLRRSSSAFKGLGYREQQQGSVPGEHRRLRSPVQTGGDSAPCRTPDPQPAHSSSAARGLCGTEKPWEGSASRRRWLSNQPLGWTDLHKHSAAPRRLLACHSGAALASQLPPSPFVQPSMFIKTSSRFADGDLSNLKRLLELIDEELGSIQSAIRKSADPETDGLLDRGEYLVGIGFAAIQQYIVGTYAQFQISKAEALELPPSTSTGVSFATALNAGANFWKHQDEWGLRAVASRETDTLSPSAQQTVKTIELLTPWDDYTLSNLLACLTQSNEPCFTNFAPILILWRSAVAALNREIS